MFHADDAKASQKDKKVVDNFEKWICVMYGEPNIVKVKSVRKTFHEYFPMTLDYTTKG